MTRIVVVGQFGMVGRSLRERRSTRGASALPNGPTTRIVVVGQFGMVGRSLRERRGTRGASALPNGPTTRIAGSLTIPVPLAYYPESAFAHSPPTRPPSFFAVFIGLGMLHGLPNRDPVSFSTSRFG